MTLNDTAYWVAVGHSNVAIGRAAHMGPVAPHRFPCGSVRFGFWCVEVISRRGFYS